MDLVEILGPAFVATYKAVKEDEFETFMRVDMLEGPADIVLYIAREQELRASPHDPVKLAQVFCADKAPFVMPGFRPGVGIEQKRPRY